MRSPRCSALRADEHGSQPQASRPQATAWVGSCPVRSLLQPPSPSGSGTTIKSCAPCGSPSRPPRQRRRWATRSGSARPAYCLHGPGCTPTPGPYAHQERCRDGRLPFPSWPGADAPARFPLQSLLSSSRHPCRREGGMRRRRSCWPRTAPAAAAAACRRAATPSPPHATLLAADSASLRGGVSFMISCMCRTHTFVGDCGCTLCLLLDADSIACGTDEVMMHRKG